MEKKRLILFGIIGPLLYFSILTLLGILWKGYNPISTGMSEIGAVDSPFRNIMNYLGFSLLGISIILFSKGFRDYFKKGWQITTAYILLLAGGISMFLVGFLPCDAMCIDVTLRGTFHSIASTISAIAVSLAIIIAAYPVSKKLGKHWGYASFYIGILSMALGPIMLSGFFDNYSGLIQRIGIGLSLLWMAVITLKLRKL